MPVVKRLVVSRNRPRAIVEPILYIARTGCQWRLLPKDFPPFTTVQGYFYDLRDQDLFGRINFELLLQARDEVRDHNGLSKGNRRFRHRQADDPTFRPSSGAGCSQILPAQGERPTIVLITPRVWGMPG